MKIAVVLLYGLYEEKREDYKGYLDFIKSEIVNEGFDKIILCGGFTNPERPSDSEASTAKEYLRASLPSADFVLEDKSITTNQNLEFAAQFVKDLSKSEIFVYGDLIRKTKIAWIAGHFLLGLNKMDLYQILIDYVHERDIYKDLLIKNLRIRTYDFNKTKEETIGCSFTTLLDVLALYDDKLNEIDLNKRKELFGI